MTPEEIVEQRAREILASLGERVSNRVPNHVIHRLVTVADPAELTYLDSRIVGDGESGYRGEIAATTRAGLLIRLTYEANEDPDAIPDPPGLTDQTCTLVLEPLRGRVTSIAMAQRDLLWQGGTVEADAVTLTTENGAPVTLPLTDQRDGPGFMAGLVNACGLS